MHVIQIVELLNYGDGVGNTVFFIKRVLNSHSIPNSILTTRCDPRITDETVSVSNDILGMSFRADDIVLFHFAIGSAINVIAESIPCRKILVFHNVTSPALLREWDYAAYMSCTSGYEDIRFSVGKYQHAIALSQFSKQTLVDAGWKPDDISIFPLHELSRSGGLYDEEKASSLKDGNVNILFTGRIAPNKKIEDLIKIFWFYNLNFNEKSRLLLVGSIGLSSYKNALDSYICENSIKNVLFTGHISDSERNAYYEAADIFLCMSEHEGFCIPLLEAFQWKLPVVAYNASAVPDTMGNAGVLVNTKEPAAICRVIEELLKNKSYRQNIIDGQLQRLSCMTLSAHDDEFVQLLQTVAGGEWELRKSSKSVWFSPLPQYHQTHETHEPFLQRNSISKVLEFSKNGGIVICGAGVAGTKLADCLLSLGGVKINAVCDAAKAGSVMSGFNVVPYDECIRLFPNSFYIITAQQYFLDIAFDLASAGVPKYNMVVFDSARRRLVCCSKE